LLWSMIPCSMLALTIYSSSWFSSCMHRTALPTDGGKSFDIIEKKRLTLLPWSLKNMRHHHATHLLLSLPKCSCFRKISQPPYYCWYASSCCCFHHTDYTTPTDISTPSDLSTPFNASAPSTGSFDTRVCDACQPFKTTWSWL
jgi:hypothetical protein